MSLDEVRAAKERGWTTVLLTVPAAQDEEGDEIRAYALLTPNGKPVEVIDKEGYGSTRGDFSEPEAWARLPDKL